MYEIFYYMVFTHYLASKIWSSIYIQDMVKPELHYQINLIRLINIIILFLHQICQTDNSDENNISMFRTQRRIKEPSQTFNTNLFVNIVIDAKPLTIFTKSSILDL